MNSKKRILQWADEIVAESLPISPATNLLTMGEKYPLMPMKVHSVQELIAIRIHASQTKITIG